MITAYKLSIIFAKNSALAGTLSVEVNQSFIMMEQAEPKLGKIFDDYDYLSGLFKIDKSQIGNINFNLVPQAAVLVFGI
ncbi:hypothetical protein ACJROX_17175 [Pseudalkalibacillus sp. A8]|uniref:hypothetical protein n=1 Tax=Pseudalkalibacillus sp. A8 TaxID=3382641 RepID=UPI0038B48E3B